MGGSTKQQTIRSIANRPSGGGNKKQGLPPSIGRPGWLSNFIRMHAGGYFRSITPDDAAPAAPDGPCVIGAVWVASGGDVTGKTWVDVTSDATGQYVWAVASDTEEKGVMYRSTDYGKTFEEFLFTEDSIDNAVSQSIAIAPDNPDIVYFGNKNPSGDKTTLYKCTNATNTTSPGFGAVTGGGGGNYFTTLSI